MTAKDLIKLLDFTVGQEKRFPTVLKASRAQLDQWTAESGGDGDFGDPPHLGVMLPHGGKYLIRIVLIPDGSEPVLISKETALLAGQVVRMNEDCFLVPDDPESFDREAVFKALLRIQEKHTREEDGNG